jgi:hypothetical protein
VELAIYAADVGSIRQGNFGWARLDPEQDSTHVERDHGGAEIGGLVDAVERDLVTEGRHVALGFECPLFVPVPRVPLRLGAPARARVIARFPLQPVVVRWSPDWSRRRGFFESFATAARRLSPLSTGPTSSGPAVDFLWEAFVSGGAKAATHVDDAQIAATAFRDSLPNPLTANAVEAQAPLSLIGAALLWSGWTGDAALLYTPCLVIKAG